MTDRHALEMVERSDNSISITLSIFAMSLLVTTGCQQSATVPIPENLHIEVTGSDFEWHVRYAGLDEKLDTKDDYVTQRNIALIAGIATTIDLKSKDYVYSFALPHLRLKEIAVPELEFSLKFIPGDTGEFLLKGDQLCGYQHPNLLGTIWVLSPTDFTEWLNHTTHVREPIDGKTTTTE